MMLGLCPLPLTIENNGIQDPLTLLFSYVPPWIGDMVSLFVQEALFAQRNIVTRFLAKITHFGATICTDCPCTDHVQIGG